MPRHVETHKARLEWSDDGSRVTKTPKLFWDDPLLGSGKRVFQNERRVTRMLSTDPPPIRVPLGYASPRRGLIVEAIDGEPLGEKFPTALAQSDIDAMVELTARLDLYQPRRRWFRRLRIDRRITIHHEAGLLTADEAESVRAAVAARPRSLRFAHGDITARNVLRDRAGELVLIDWEWAGLYPEGYELAFLWFALIDVPRGRHAVERAVPEQKREWFTISRLLVQLLHLHMWHDRQQPPRPAHTATRDLLIQEVREL